MNGCGHTQRDKHESSRDAKRQRVALLMGVNPTLLSCNTPPQHTHTHIQSVCDATLYTLRHVWPRQTFQDGGDECGQQAAGIDGEVEDGKEGASLLFLRNKHDRHWRHLRASPFNPDLERTHGPALIS